MEPKVETVPTKKLAITALILAAMPFSGYAVCASASKNDEGPIFFYLFTVLCAVVGAILGLVQILRFTNKRYGLIAVLLGVGSPIITAALGIATGHFDMTSGRPLRRRGRARVPELKETNDWCNSDQTEAQRIEAPEEAADAWRRNAATEAASVAAFAHLSNELLAIGAPARLIEHAHRDALDELRHAKLCYGLATAIDGEHQGPAPFPEAMWPREHRPTLESVAADCLIESCVFEAASALAAKQLSERDDVPAEIARVLRILAADEAIHAAHGYEILEHCLAEGGAAIQTTLEQALADLDVNAAQATDRGSALEPYGIAGAKLWSGGLEESKAEARSWLRARSAPRPSTLNSSTPRTGNRAEAA